MELLDQDRVRADTAARRAYAEIRESLLLELSDLEREESVLHARRALAMDELRAVAAAEHRFEHDVDDRSPGPVPEVVIDEVVAEIGALRRLSRGVIEAELGDSWTLCRELPALHHAAGCGAAGRRHTSAVIAESGPVLAARRDALAELEAAERAGADALRLAPLRTALETAKAACDTYDETAAAWAAELSPAALRRRCRRLAARLTHVTAQQRHRAAREARSVRVFDTNDGMSELVATVPTVLATAIHDRLSQQATVLARADGETRSFDQLRADLFCDLLLTSDPSAPHDAARGIDATISITVPLLTLLGVDREPATLNGLTPIPMADALRFAAEAPAWLRVLTDPVTGVVREVDGYRPSAALRSLIGARDLVCRFPGCSRAAHRSDLDHAVAWVDGGATTEANLGVLCRHHHTFKHASRWEVAVHRKKPGLLVWTSPSDRSYWEQPPPIGPVFAHADQVIAPGQAGPSPGRSSPAIPSTASAKPRRVPGRSGQSRHDREPIGGSQGSGMGPGVDRRTPPQPRTGFRTGAGVRAGPEADSES